MKYTDWNVKKSRWPKGAKHNMDFIKKDE
jgi:hypothetical protein